MTAVLLYGPEKETQMTNTLLGAVRAVNKSALHITKRAAALIPPGADCPDFLVLDNTDFSYLQLNRGVVVFKPGFSDARLGGIPKDFYAVVDPDNAQAVELLRRNCMRTITCGLSQKDSVTFSSIGTDSAVVSLQRGLATLDGKTAEPLELPVEFGKGCSQYALLASVAVLFLSGNIGQESKIRIS